MSQGVGLGKHGVDRHTHVTLEIVPEQAAVVQRIFELAASSVGDRRIAAMLNAEHVPAPGTRWGKCETARCLSNELYRGVQIYGKRGAAPETWIRTELPDLRIIDEPLWQRVRARKAQTAKAYARDSAGHLLSKPETALTSKYLLSGFARCWSCGGSLNVMRKPNERAKYFCSRRYSRPGSCQNSRGVPMTELDQSVGKALHCLLTDAPETVTRLVAERDAVLRAQQATHGDRREAALQDAERLEGEIKNLIAVTASGSASADITAAIIERRAKVEALRATPAPRPSYDVAAIFRKFAGDAQIGTFLASYAPVQTRAAMRRLGVARVVVTPDGQGWKFEGTADLERVINGCSAVSSEPTGSP